MQYSNLSTIYDKMIDVNYDEWLNFIETYFLNKGKSIKGAQILELGCGTGNMTLRLKGKGAEVTALDVSEDMLATAQEKALKHRYKINFLNMDMAEFQINRNFDYICSFCDAYNYILEENDIKSSFEKVYEKLKPGGSFVFDISTEHKLKNIIGNNTFTLNEEAMCYIWDNYFENDQLDMYITFFVKEGRLYNRIEETHIQKAHKTEILWKYLIEAGFKSVQIYEDYSLNSLKDDSIRATFVAEK